MLEDIEREFEAATIGLEQLKANDFSEGNNNEEQSAKRKSMLEEIEREFEAAIGGLKQIKVDDSRNLEEECKLSDPFFLFKTFSYKICNCFGYNFLFQLLRER